MKTTIQRYQYASDEVRQAKAEEDRLLKEYLARKKAQNRVLWRAKKNIVVLKTISDEKKNYRSFMSTELWRKTRNKKLSECNYCQKCGDKNHLNIHHKSYKGKLKYFPPMSNLTVLCKTCHELFHKQFGVKEVMIKETDLFLSTR